MILVGLDKTDSNTRKNEVADTNNSFLEGLLIPHLGACNRTFRGNNWPRSAFI